MHSPRPRPRQAYIWAVALLAGWVSSFGPVRTATALPAPLTEAQLIEKSQLVIVADVLGVACTGMSRTDHPRYTAWIQVVETQKGGVAPGSTLQLAWSAVDLTLLGAWEPRVYPGDRVRLYLVPADEPGTWKVFHYLGAVEITRVPAADRQLPERPGQVRFRPSPPAKPSPAPKGSDPKAAPPGPSSSVPPARTNASNRTPRARSQGGFAMTSTTRTMLSAALALGFSAPLPGLAGQDEPRPAPTTGVNQDQSGKPSKIGKPTQVPAQGPEQVAIGVISQIDLKARTISVQPSQNVAFQYQGKLKPTQGQKADTSGMLILVVDDRTVVRSGEAKGMPAQSVSGLKGKPAQDLSVKPTGGQQPVKPTQIQQQVKPTQTQQQIKPTQGQKIQPVKPTLGPEPVEPGPIATSDQQQLSGLQVGQTVRVVYQQQTSKLQATQIRVLPAQQTAPESPGPALPPPAPATGTNP